MDTNSKPLVSVLTPCYNTGRYIHRLLDSVIMQDYPRIQMIVVDDGSTDGSADIIKSYVPLFHGKGYTLEYYRQENAGQSSAINRGLKKVRGEYLLWPDSDDFYRDDDTISLLVETLRALPGDYAMARTWINYLDENSLDVIGVDGPDKGESEFENCLFARNFCFPPGGVIVDFEKLREATSLEIYCDRNAGQNWQLYLPILFKYKCRTIPQAKYNVLSRADSHSRGRYKSPEELIAKTNSYENTILVTLDGIKGLSSTKKEEYKKAIRKKYAGERFAVAMSSGDRRMILKYKAELKSLGLSLDKRDAVKCSLAALHLLGLARRINAFTKARP